MNSNENETVADIVNIMRGAIYPVSRCPDLTMRGYADRVEAAHRREVDELRECLRIIRDNLLLHTIKSADGKYVNNGAFLPEEFVDDERWRKALRMSE